MIALIAEPTHFQTGDKLADSVGAGEQAGNDHHRGRLRRNTAGKVHARQRARRTKTGRRFTQQVAGKLAEHNYQRQCEEDQQPAHPLLRRAMQDFSRRGSGQQAQAAEP
ncbi:hypothetical protein D3C72_420110 [compost metagenome]